MLPRGKILILNGKSTTLSKPPGSKPKSSPETACKNTPPVIFCACEVLVGDVIGLSGS